MDKMNIIMFVSLTQPHTIQTSTLYGPSVMKPPCYKP